MYAALDSAALPTPRPLPPTPPHPSVVRWWRWRRRRASWGLTARREQRPEVAVWNETHTAKTDKPATHRTRRDRTAPRRTHPPGLAPTVPPADRERSHEPRRRCAAWRHEQHTRVLPRVTEGWRQPSVSLIPSPTSKTPSSDTGARPPGVKVGSDIASGDVKRRRKGWPTGSIATGTVGRVSRLGTVVGEVRPHLEPLR